MPLGSSLPGHLRRLLEVLCCLVRHLGHNQEPSRWLRLRIVVAGGPFVWVYLPMQPSKVLATFPELMDQVILKAVE